MLAIFYTQGKEDEQRVVQLLQRLVFVLSLEKCQLELTQEFTHSGLVFKTQNVTLSLPQDKVLKMKAQTAKVASSPTCRGVMKLLDLTNFAGMVLPLAGLHCHPYNTGSMKITRLQLICSKAEAKSRGCSDPALVVHLPVTTKVNMQMLNKGGCDNRCFQGGL